MISRDEAFLLFRRWTGERTPLRVAFKLPTCEVSADGRIGGFRDDVLCFRCDPLGFIEINLPDDTVFDYCDPDSMRVNDPERIGEGHMGEPVRHGAAVIAVHETGESFFFVEIEKV